MKPRVRFHKILIEIQDIPILVRSLFRSPNKSKSRVYKKEMKALCPKLPSPHLYKYTTLTCPEYSAKKI